MLFVRNNTWYVCVIFAGGDDTVGTTHRAQFVKLVVVRAYPLIQIRQTVPCRAIRGNSVSVNGALPPLLYPAEGSPWSYGLATGRDTLAAGRRYMYVYMYVYIHNIYIYIHTYFILFRERERQTYIYIYIERERERCILVVYIFV